MKYAHSIKLNVFSYEDEDSKVILDSFLRFFPFSLEENKIAVKKTHAIGFSEKKIGIFEATLTKENLVNRFINNILKNLGKGQKNLILQQAESRLDENLDFFLRFDKDSWIDKNKLNLTDLGKCFHLKISIAAFPKKRGVALNIIRKIFNSPNLKILYSKCQR